MRTVVRQAVFETNSSSSHAFVVFEDQGLQDAWMSSPDAYLDMRGALWTDYPYFEDLAELEEDMKVATDADIIMSGSDEYYAALDWAKEKWGDPDHGYGDDMVLGWQHVVKYPGDGYNPDSDFCVHEGAGMGDGTRVLEDSAGNPIFEIVMYS